LLYARESDDPTARELRPNAKSSPTSSALEIAIRKKARIA
jgi:hypothetical protein